MKISIKAGMNILLLFLSIVVILLSFTSTIVSKSFLGVYLLFLNFILLIKCRKNKKLYFLFFALFYFNFSVAITKYIGVKSDMLEAIYRNIKGENTFIYGIDSLILFFSLLNMFFIGDTFNNEIDIPKFDDKKKNRRTISFFMISMLLFILFYHVYNKITSSTTLLEYSIIIFIFQLFISKKYWVERITTEILLLLFVLFSVYNGDRIAVLQLLLADLFINYIDKISIKNITIGTFFGVLAFTLFGIYGDYLDAGVRANNISIIDTVSVLKDRRFAIDTSVAAYHSGLTFIDNKDKYTAGFKIKNGIKYFTLYSTLGTKISGYIPLTTEIKTYSYNLGGGYLTSYFFYWFGWLGIILISVYLFFIIKYALSKGLYNYLLGIFVFSTFPRWYLYAPDLLFRGILLFSVSYLILFKFIFRSSKGEI